MSQRVKVNGQRTATSTKISTIDVYAVSKLVSLWYRYRCSLHKSAWLYTIRPPLLVVYTFVTERTTCLSAYRQQSINNTPHSGNKTGLMILQSRELHTTSSLNTSVACSGCSFMNYRSMISPNDENASTRSCAWTCFGSFPTKTSLGEGDIFWNVRPYGLTQR